MHRRVHNKAKQLVTKSDASFDLKFVGNATCTQRCDHAIAKGATEKEKRPMHVMSANFCNGWQNPVNRFSFAFSGEF